MGYLDDCIRNHRPIALFMEREITPDTVIMDPKTGDALRLRDIDADSLTWEQLIDIIPPNLVTNLFWDHTPWRKVKCDRIFTSKYKLTRKQLAGKSDGGDGGTASGDHMNMLNMLFNDDGGIDSEKLNAATAGRERALHEAYLQKIFSLD